MRTDARPPATPSRVVIDASALVAFLTDGAELAAWVTREIRDSAPTGPDLLLFETANLLRRLESARVIDPTTASMAHVDLLDLSVWLVGYAPLADRARELRANLTTYDASYVALAEALEAPLVTLDARIARAPGIRCEVRLPPSLTPRARRGVPARGA
ncbi:MAG: type II toxin-antitoxin system VapC family toxin [Chloroflexota bacterium]